MTTILRGIKRTDDLADEDSVFDSLTEFLGKSWLDRMFSEQYFQPAEMELGTGAAKALDGYKMLMEDNTAAFPKTVQSLIRRVFDEDSLPGSEISLSED